MIASPIASLLHNWPKHIWTVNEVFVNCARTVHAKFIKKIVSRRGLLVLWVHWKISRFFPMLNHRNWDWLQLKFFTPKSCSQVLDVFIFIRDLRQCVIVCFYTGLRQAALIRRFIFWKESHGCQELYKDVPFPIAIADKACRWILITESRKTCYVTLIG